MRKTFASPHRYRRRSAYTRNKRRFTGIIITRHTLIAAACVLSAALFLFTAWAAVRSYNARIGEEILQKGMAQAVPFLSCDDGADNAIGKISQFVLGFDVSDMSALAASASPMFCQTEEKQIVKETPPATPKHTETNVASVNLSIKNESKYEVNTAELLKEPIKFDISPDKPSVLIVHTHASESYTPSEAYNYTQSGNFRTQDNKYNMIRVGDEITKYLKSEGVNVIHDKTINDYPSYNSSYNKTEAVIRSNLEKYPFVRIVLDIHRDAVGDSENGIKFTSAVDGEKAAQAMLVCGTDQNLENPNWRKNLAFALKIQQYFESEYPTFMRPLNLRSERFNMHLTTGSLLIEIGTNSNTMDEALASARCLGKGLGKVINSLS